MADIVKLTIKDETCYPLSIPEAMIDPEDNKPLSDVLPNIKDKKYDSTKYSGMGRKYLKKNMINGINVLEQDMISEANTIYIIQYDYDLQGQTITVPKNCVLQFEGGSFSNGSIVGNNTAIQASLTKIFGLDVEFTESWNVVEVYPEWFGAKGDGITDDIIAIQTCINKMYSMNKNKISFKNLATYVISYPIIIDKQRINIDGNRATIFKNTNTPANVGFKACITGGDVNCNVDAVILSVDNFVLSEINNITLKHSNTDTGIGLFLLNSQKSKIEHLYVKNVNIGIQIKNAFVTTFSSVLVETCKKGFFFDNTREEGLGACGTTCKLSNCYVIGVPHLETWAYDVNDLSYSSFDNCAADICTEPYRFANSNICLIGCGCEVSGKFLTSIDSLLTFNNFNLVQWENSFPQYYFAAYVKSSKVSFTNSNILSNKKGLADIVNNSILEFNDCVINYIGLGKDEIRITDSDKHSYVKFKNGVETLIKSVNEFGSIKQNKINDAVDGGLRKKYYGHLDSGYEYIKFSIGQYTGRSLDEDYGSIAGGFDINLFADSDNSDIAARGALLWIKWLPSSFSPTKSFILYNGNYNDNSGFLAYCITSTAIYFKKYKHSKIHYEVLGQLYNVSASNVEASEVSSLSFTNMPKNEFIISGEISAKTISKSSENRPGSPIKGSCIFDTTLNKPIWWNGTKWIDANGAEV